jgi:hypothetical protein
LISLKALDGLARYHSAESGATPHPILAALTEWWTIIAPIGAVILFVLADS